MTRLIKNITKKLIKMKKTNKSKKEKLKVRIYSTPTCPWCKTAKEFLKENKISFKDIDVSKDRKAAEEMIKKSGQMGVPVIDINGKIIIGFDQDKLEKAIKIE